MLLIIQYTITDYRRLIDYNCGLLSSPDWPSPDEEEFIKSMGQIGNRNSGGLNNWVGESKICLAKKAIKINKWLSFSKSKSYNIKLIFRRFYFDGFVSGKYEFGFNIDPRNDYIPISKIIEDLFSLTVRIPSTGYQEQLSLLGNAEDELKAQYLSSTTYIKAPLNTTQEQVICSPPNIFIEKKKDEKVKLGIKGSSIHMDKINLTIYHFNLKLKIKENHKRDCSLWLLENANTNLFKLDYDENANKRIRDIRVFLSRINSTRISLKEVLNEIKDGNIKPTPRSVESNILQEFMLSSIKNILRKESGFENDDLLILIRDIENRIIPGSNNELFQKLKKTICIRPQVLEKVIEFLEQEELFKKLNDKLDIALDELKDLKDEHKVIHDKLKEIKNKLDKHYQYLIKLPVNNNIKEDITGLINQLNKQQIERITEDIMKEVVDIFESYHGDMAEILTEIYTDLKRTDDTQMKLKLSVPFINLLGINLESEFDIKSWATKMYKKHELKVFKLMGYI